MGDFAKLFQSEKYGQICVIKQGNDDLIPEIRFFVEPETLGVCQKALTFEDTDEGWDSCDKAFETIDVGVAEIAVKDIFDLV